MTSKDTSALVEKLYSHIAHGDGEHRHWLYTELRRFYGLCTHENPAGLKGANSDAGRQPTCRDCGEEVSPFRWVIEAMRKDNEPSEPTQTVEQDGWSAAERAKAFMIQFEYAFAPELHDKIFNALEHLIRIDRSARAPAVTEKGYSVDWEKWELKTDAKRYWRLRVLGCAPMGTEHLENGTVMRFTNLDEFVDKDIEDHPSRGEAELSRPDNSRGDENG